MSSFIAFTSSFIPLISTICCLSAWLLWGSFVLWIQWFVLTWMFFSEHYISICFTSSRCYILNNTSPRFSNWPSLLVLMAHCVCSAGTSNSTYSNGIYYITSLLTPALLADLQFCLWYYYFFPTHLGSKFWSHLWVLLYLFYHFSHQVIFSPSKI